MLLYYITDRHQFPGDETACTGALLAKITEASRCGVDLIQVREKDISGRQLESLAAAAVRAVRENSATIGNKSATRILINSRTDIAIACAADGVHLPSHDVDPGYVRTIWRSASSSGQPQRAAKSAPVISASCHSVEDVARAASGGVDFAILAPIFEKHQAPQVQPVGIEMLREACGKPIPVIALGGITLENAARCIAAGAAGIAAIRLFQQSDIADVVRRLRG